MKTYQLFIAHYNYADTPEAKALYTEYTENFAILQAMSVDIPQK